MQKDLQKRMSTTIRVTNPGLRKKKELSGPEMIALLEADLLHRKYLRQKLFFKAFFTFFFEVVLMGSIANYVYMMRNDYEMYQVHYFGSWLMCICAAIGVQLNFQPLIQEDLTRMRYLYLHHDKFE